MQVTLLLFGIPHQIISCFQTRALIQLQQGRRKECIFIQIHKVNLWQTTLILLSIPRNQMGKMFLSSRV